jgi:hypothetical protein
VAFASCTLLQANPDQLSKQFSDIFGLFVGLQYYSGSVNACALDLTVNEFLILYFNVNLNSVNDTHIVFATPSVANRIVISNITITYNNSGTRNFPVSFTYVNNPLVSLILPAASGYRR